eukprot:533892-Rhodomonas_salina.2
MQTSPPHLARKIQLNDDETDDSDSFQPFSQGEFAVSACNCDVHACGFAVLTPERAAAGGMISHQVVDLQAIAEPFLLR